MYNRLKIIRDSTGKNQSDFAKSLGIGQSTLAMMEVGKREIHDRHIKTICSIYSINEDWFKTGQGEMKISEGVISLDEFAIENNLDDLDKTIIAKFLQMDKTKRDFMIRHIRDYLEITNTETQK